MIAIVHSLNGLLVGDAILLLACHSIICMFFLCSAIICSSFHDVCDVIQIFVLA